MSDEGRVTLQRHGRVGRIVLERPDKLNALVGGMREELRDRIAEAAGDDEITSLVITGAGDAFCSGGDVRTMARLRQEEDHGALHGILHAGAEAVLALQAFPGLTIAAVRGVAAGAGLALALNCDLRVAADDSRLVASWGRIALAPDWGATFWLPRLLGYSRALKLVLGSDVLEAAEAAELGLLHELVPSEDVLDRAHGMALELGAAGETVRHVKYLLRKGLQGSLEESLAAETEVQEDLFDSDDVAEGLRAFVEKRPPEFEGH